MIVWRGRGILVFILGLIAIAAPLGLDDTYIRYVQLVTFCLAGFLLWILGSKWNAGQNHFSKKRGKFYWKDIFEVDTFDYNDPDIPLGIESPSHSFLTVKMQYWSFVFYLIGALFLILALIHSFT